eukprot:TRINITY_DN11386_c0_g1_i1.p1 TRINITY_DN11386_c0_g1~~TRINITY_DN11386_c0_g1_i1.p1  ORF type:complete len:523 (+),score=161.20 TRINITY_DN11386_c0_g1_i1:162-1571(+)
MKAAASARTATTSPSKKRARSSEGESPAGKLRKGSSTEALEKAKAAAKSSRGASKGGKKTVDRSVPSAGNYKVYEDYAVKLNQTNVGGNNNKFYIIQVLEGGGKYHSWNRWGRIGEPGQHKMTTFPSPEKAIKDFEHKFREKTKNAWDNRDNFKPAAGKYIIVETEDGGGGGDQAPLGKLTEAQIGKGQAVLEKIAAALKKANATTLADLSSQFYSLIPHDFGRKRPVSINNSELLEQQQELLKFYLRMGFEQIEKDSSLTPVDGVMELPVPRSLDDAAGAVASKPSITASNRQAGDLCKKQAGKPTRKMTDKEYAAIMLYTSNAIYKELNQALRDGNRGKLKKFFKYLRLFFESMDALPKRKCKLWRGLSVDLHSNPQYKVGNTVVWWGVSSCTSDQKVAQNFAHGCGGKSTVITIESKTASDISQITFYSNEKESLLCPGTELKVKSNKMNGNVCEIVLEEVGRLLN